MKPFMKRSIWKKIIENVIDDPALSEGIVFGGSDTPTKQQVAIKTPNTVSPWPIVLIAIAALLTVGGVITVIVVVKKRKNTGRSK